MRVFSRVNIVGIIIAVICGIVVSFPTILVTHFSNYQKAPFLYTDAEGHYLGRIYAAYDGCIFACNPYTAGYGSTKPYIDPSLAEAFLAIPGILFHLTIPTIKILYDFLLPSVLGFSVFKLALLLYQGNKWGAAASSFAIVLSSSYINLQSLWTLFYPNPLLDSGFAGIFYMRPINPQFSSIPLILFFVTFVYFSRKPCWKNLGIVLLISTVNFYTYFFTYSYVAVFEGVAVVVFFILKNKQAAIRILYVFLGSILLSLPVLRQLVLLLLHPSRNSVLLPGFTTISTHRPFLSPIGFTAFFLSFLLITLYYKKYNKFDATTIFFIVAISSCFLIENQHVITGKFLQYHHYNYYINTPIYVLSFIYFLHELCKEKMRKCFAVFCIVIAMVAIISGIKEQWEFFKMQKSYIERTQTYMSLVQWIAKYVPEHSIVYAPYEITYLLPMYTHLYYYWHPFELQYIIDEKQIEETQPRNTLNINLLRKYKVQYFVAKKNEYKEIQEQGEKLYTDGSYTVYKIH